MAAVRFSIHASHCCGERAKGPSAPPGGLVHGVRVRRNAPVIVTPTPHGGTHRCRPTFPDGLPTWFVGRVLCVPPPECAGHRHPHTARRHTQVPPYIPRRTADIVRRARPVCPAAGMYRKPRSRLIRSACVGRGLAPFAGTDLPLYNNSGPGVHGDPGAN